MYSYYKSKWLVCWQNFWPYCPELTSWFLQQFQFTPRQAGNFSCYYNHFH